MSKITGFEELECWQEARELARLAYGATKVGEIKKDLRLAGQIQAAAASVMANIAEGFTRRSNKEFTQFLFIAISSAAEVQSHLYVALDQGYLSNVEFQRVYGQAEKTAMIISGLIRYLRTKSTSSPEKERSTAPPIPTKATIPTTLTKPTRQTRQTR